MAANANDAVTNQLLKDMYDNEVKTKLTAPAVPGTSGQVLTSDGSGGTSWATVPGGTSYEGVAPVNVTGNQISVSPAGEGSQGTVKFATLADFRTYMGYTVG